MGICQTTNIIKEEKKHLNVMISIAKKFNSSLCIDNYKSFKEYISSSCDSNIKILSKKTLLRDSFFEEVTEYIEDLLINGQYNQYTTTFHNKILYHIVFISVILTCLEPEAQRSLIDSKIIGITQILINKSGIESHYKAEILFYLTDSLHSTIDHIYWIDNQLEFTKLVLFINTSLHSIKQIKEKSIFASELTVLISQLIDKSNAFILSEAVSNKLIEILLFNIIQLKTEITEQKEYLIDSLKEKELAIYKVNSQNESAHSMIDKRTLTNIGGRSKMLEMLSILTPNLDGIIKYFIKFISDVSIGKVLWSQLLNYITKEIDNRPEADNCIDFITKYIIFKASANSEALNKNLSYLSTKTLTDTKLTNESIDQLREYKLIVLSIVSFQENNDNRKDEISKNEYNDYSHSEIKNNISQYSIIVKYNMNDLNDSLDYKNKLDSFVAFKSEKVNNSQGKFNIPIEKISIPTLDRQDSDDYIQNSPINKEKLNKVLFEMDNYVNNYKQDL